MSEENGILIVGGSGTVGRKIAGFLAPDYPGQVVIASRNYEKAQSVATGIGYGTSARTIDVRDRQSIEAAMDGIGIVMSCVAQPDLPNLLLAAISHGCGYTDIAPGSNKRPPYPDTLKTEARHTGARIILGAGMVPGISNVFARMGAACVGPVISIESTCLLSAGDEYGQDSKGFITEEVVTSFETMIAGSKALVKPFTGSKKVDFLPPIGRVTAYPFPFSDQIFYPDTLGAQTAISRISLLPQWIPAAMAALLPVVGKQLAKPRKKGGLGGLMDTLKRRYRGLNWWGVHLQMQGAKGSFTAVVQGHGQAEATALSASAFLRALIEGEIALSGIWTADQVVPADPFLKRLEAHGLVPTIKMNRAQ